MNPNLVKLLKSLGHLALGGTLAAIAPHVADLVPLIPHIDPTTAMIVGSVASSAISAFMKPPHHD